MSSLTNYWRVVKPQPVRASYAAQDTYTTDSPASFDSNSWYTTLMQGSTSRAQEYQQFEMMDRDVYVYRALDTIAEEMTNNNEVNRLPFDINYNNDDNREVSENVVMTVKAALRQWVQTQDLKSRIFRIARMTIRNGDCFFRKLREHKKWQYVNPADIIGIEVDQFGDVVSYHVRTKSSANSGYGQQREEMEIVPPHAIVHFSLSDSMGPTSPFGESILKPVVRTFKQMGLLEDAIIIYRVVRAPERRVFYIDTGNMPPQKTKAYLESVKNELKQKRVPLSNDSGDDIESMYNPTSMSEDYFLGTTANGRGSRIETLPGGTSLGETDDLKHFMQKLLMGLRVPTSYMRGSADGGAQYNDGKLGIAYIEELRFSNFVQRLQSRIEGVFDAEFKTYLKNSGIVIDESLFNLTLPVPQNFDVYRQTALNAELFNTFQNADQVKYLSKRFILKTFLHLGEDAIQTNEAMLRQERGIDPEDENSLRKFYDPAFYENVEPVKFDAEGGEEAGDAAADDMGDMGDLGDMGDMGGDEPAADKPPRPEPEKPDRPEPAGAAKPARPGADEA